MKKLLKLTFVSIFAVVLVFSLHSRSFAEDSTTSAKSTPAPTLRLRQELRNDVKEVRQDVKNDIKNKLADKASSNSSTFKQKACEQHIKVIKIRQLNIGTRGLTMLKRFDRISSAVQKYYTEKLMPAGKVVPNYEGLVTYTNEKKAALQPLIDKIKTDSNNLTCDASTNKAQFETFKTDAKALLEGVKAYRDSVIVLVKAVRTAAEEVNNSATQSATQEVSQ